ncbi:hypothetical protein FGLOB1_367 [Fusarium globosum]|uniref:Serpin domain-containing protein n=1 Tax=Fusarium globosum TaxID=78864 RepID=A0A8H5YZM6_9HYPO|nr:hypothetical protein FGLOB1_367 [Fusarium globosum]
MPVQKFTVLRYLSLAVDLPRRSKRLAGKDPVSETASSLDIPVPAPRPQQIPHQLSGPSSAPGKHTQQLVEQRHREQDGLATCPSISQTTKNIGWSLLQRVAGFQHADQVEATVLSPISVLIAVSMLAGAADSHRRSQLQQKLGVGEGLETHVSALYADLAPLAKQDIISLANAVFVDQSVEIATKYKKYLEAFQAQSWQFPSLADSVKDINSWISQNTLGRITDLLSSRALRKRHVVLANATAFRGTWKTKFNRGNTVLEHPFHLENGSIRAAEMMFLYKEYVETASSSDYTAVRVPYATESDSSPAALVAWLPNPGITIRSLLEQLSTTQSEGPSFRRRKLTKFGFPKFETRSKVSLMDELAGLGFPIKGNYPEMGSGPTEVTAISHEASIKVDEEGAEAAAATVVMVARKRSTVVSEEVLDEKRSVPTAQNNTEPTPPTCNLDLTNFSMSSDLINLQAEQHSQEDNVVT